MGSGWSENGAQTLGCQFSSGLSPGENDRPVWMVSEQKMALFFLYSLNLIIFLAIAISRICWQVLKKRSAR
jgi:hypothetical protein